MRENVVYDSGKVYALLEEVDFQMNKMKRFKAITDDVAQLKMRLLEIKRELESKLGIQRDYSDFGLVSKEWGVSREAVHQAYQKAYAKLKGLN